MILRVNWNGTRKKWTVKEGAKPAKYWDSLVLRDVQLSVEQSARKLFLQKRSAASHAFLVGTLVEAPVPAGKSLKNHLELVYWAPYCPFFYVLTPGKEYGKPVWRAEQVLLLAEGKILARLP